MFIGKSGRDSAQKGTVLENTKIPITELFHVVRLW